ncbi:hypothetical protein RJ640_021309 [Escallonia rubra]|uniref:Pectinesterase inhibitor domain-containing protein n=1 Tax=Escallonia rubra TaxID=112253 RepID=A0AA88R4Y1_9ASTE|nr:hypothetical protein RJ640_021309 [Escallonia rubra]
MTEVYAQMEEWMKYRKNTKLEKGAKLSNQPAIVPELEAAYHIFGILMNVVVIFKFEKTCVVADSPTFNDADRPFLDPHLQALFSRVFISKNRRDEENLLRPTVGTCYPLLLVTRSLAKLSVKNASLIEQVCQKTMYHDLCVSSLRSNPRSSGADVKGLARIILELFLDASHQQSRPSPLTATNNYVLYWGKNVEGIVAILKK